MASLYKIIETNTDETKNQDIERVEILFDLKNETYKIIDKSYAKEFVCACGSCDLYLEKDGKQAIVTLDNVAKTIHVNKDVSVELRNSTDNIKVIVEYLNKMAGTNL